MNTKLKNRILVFLMVIVVFGFSIAAIVKTPDMYSLSERRTLAQFPKLTWAQLTSGKFMTQFEDYTLDQFPLRNRFRTLKALSSRYLLHQMDNRGLYVADGYVSKLEYPLNDVRLEHSIKKLQEIYDVYLADTDCSLYLSVIPDKNYFLAPLYGYLTMDYERLVQTMREQLTDASYIDLFEHLSLEDYYKTDQHWRQECISDVAQILAQGMGSDLSTSFTEHTLEVPFYGTYCGQAALNFNPDTIRYLTSDILDQCIVTSFSTGKPMEMPMYNMDKANGKDPYEMFLSGSEALLTIENPNATEEKELIIFRDSFSSSLAPLLASGYSKITLVDLRYVRSDAIGNFVDFHGQDVLFLYSTLILNNTISM